MVLKRNEVTELISVIESNSVFDCFYYKFESLKAIGIKKGSFSAYTVETRCVVCVQCIDISIELPNAFVCCCASFSSCICTHGTAAPPPIPFLQLCILLAKMFYCPLYVDMYLPSPNCSALVILGHENRFVGYYYKPAAANPPFVYYITTRQQKIIIN